MTKDEVAKLIERVPGGLTPDEFIVALAIEVAAAEREACAKECEKHPGHWAKFFAKAVRNRGLA